MRDHISAIAFADDKHGVAVGYKGRIERTEDGGRSWTSVEIPVIADLTDVAFADSLHGIAVGRDTAMSVAREVTIRTEDGGKTWQHVGAISEARAPINLYAVSYPDAQHAQAVGMLDRVNGEFLKTDDAGATWQRLSTNVDNVLRGVSFIDANTGWVVGEGGTILHTTNGGATWSLQGNKEDTTNHHGVFFLDRARGWVVGERGDVHRTTNAGRTWEKTDAGVQSDLIAVRFRNENEGYVLGSGGLVISTKDGGKSWQPLSVQPDRRVTALALRPDGALALASPDGRIELLQEGSFQTSPASNNPPAASAPSPTLNTASQKSIREQVRETPVPLSTRLVGLLGIVILIGLLYLASNNRPRIEWRLVAVGLGLQLIIALLILRTETGFLIFDYLGDGISALLAFSNEGAKFVFGRLADPAYIDALSHTQTDPQAFKNSYGLIFAFVILPTIIFVASIFAILYHLGVMQRVVYGLAWVMQRTMRSISGAEALTTAAEVFMGQTEAPLTVAPYIPRMTHSELLAMMIGGMGTVSGGVLAAYIGLGIDPVFLITTSVMAAPACLMTAKMLYPETEVPETAGGVQLRSERVDANIIDAAARGAGEGMRLALNVAAMLIAFIALVALINALLGWLGGATGLNALLGKAFSLEVIFGYLFAPLAFVMGVPWADATKVGDLLGTKLILNEFVAYLKMSPTGGNVQATLQPRSILIATFALCGFANIASVGIIIGGIGGLAPERRSDLARLGWRALLGGFTATCITATIAGLLS
ncbi:MAG: hypothetical protein H0T92_11900 [Pyrinomonadaceae bacterium]|nr:hypothetical protein [Pyrinomonadaceae bacterium]